MFGVAFEMRTALLFFFTLIFSTACGQSQDDGPVTLESIRKNAKVPALGVIAIVDGEIQPAEVTGLRKYKGSEAVTADDKWHIGSCTKSMTATLAATFVEEGKLKWETTVDEILGLDIKIPDEAKGITLYMLVSNRSGIPGTPPPKIWSKAWMLNREPNIKKRRLAFAESMLSVDLEFEPGTKYAYSNSGFIVAGAMLAKVGGKSWEELITERVFEPLGMESAGFGGAASEGKEDQPWGHKSTRRSQEPGPKDDNPDVVGPAGTVHASLGDLAKYVRMHATHEVGPVLKKTETFEFLQSIAEENDGKYACGWIVLERGWAQGPALMHNGSNTMNYCVIWMAPKRKFAAIAVSNIGPDEAAMAADQAVSKIAMEKLK